MRPTPFEKGQTVKVIQLSGKLAKKYLRKPGKEGVILRLDRDKALIRFKRNPDKRCLGYYRHDHWLYLSDLRIIKKHKSRSTKRSRTRHSPTALVSILWRVPTILFPSI